MILDPHSFYFSGFWYGGLASLFLLSFASLAYEIRHAQDCCLRADDQDAWVVVQRTLHLNFLAHLILHATLGISCLALYGANREDGRDWLMLGILCTSAYWSYTRACEKRLLRFMALAESTRHAQGAAR